jgi:hypothetical protein
MCLLFKRNNKDSHLGWTGGNDVVYNYKEEGKNHLGGNLSK